MSLVDTRELTTAAPANVSSPRRLGLTSFYDLALRNMSIRLVRTLLTALGIVIGVAVILAVDVTNATTLASIRNLFDETSGRASLLVEPAATGSQGFDERVVETLRRLDGVVAAAPMISVRAALASGSARNALHAFDTDISVPLRVVGVDPSTDPQVHIYRLLDGRLLRPDDSRVVVLTSSLADDLERGVGDEVEIITPDGTAALEIVGIIDKEGIGRTNDGRVLIVPLSTAQDLFFMRSQLTQIDVMVAQEIAEDPGRLERLKVQMDARLPRDVNVSYPAARGKLISQMLRTYQLGLSFFGAVAIFVGGFLIYNTFSMTVLERTREIGMLRSIGATRRQIVGLILAESLVLALVGSLLGVASGLGLARGLIQTMTGLLGTELETFALSPFSLIKSVAVGVGVTLASSLVPAFQAGRVVPLEALRVYGQRARDGVWPKWVHGFGFVLFVGCVFLFFFLEALIPPALKVQVGITSVFGLLLGAALLVPPVLGLVEPAMRRGLALFYGPEGQLGSRNVERSPLRTALTVAALMVGVTMIIALGEMSNSFRQDILAWVETAIGGDLYVRSTTPMRPELGRRLLAVSGVKAVSPVNFFRVRTWVPGDDEPNTVVGIAIDPATYLQVASFKFADRQVDVAARVQELAEQDALFISTTLADRYNLRAGDTIVLETRRGRRSFRVAAVSVDFTAQGNTVTISRRTLYRYFGERRVTSFTVDVLPDADPEAVRQAIEDRFGKGGRITVESSQEFRERIIRLMNQSFALLNTLVAIAVLISSFGLINTLLMNIFERTREIGMLRSLGATRGQIVKMVLAESATMGVAGGLLGLALGLLLARFMVQGLNVAGGYRLVYHFTPLPVLMGLALALVISQVAALYPARRAAGVNVVEAIKHE
ncbi:MAG: ABC transporter permease [Ardenticatenia bacterium]|nr:ABC transporter permease [Ardenticatenia bacterium]